MEIITGSLQYPIGQVNVHCTSDAADASLLPPFFHFAHSSDLSNVHSTVLGFSPHWMWHD
jgi:murein tripeptide amidase MpaA